MAADTSMELVELGHLNLSGYGTDGSDDPRTQFKYAEVDDCYVDYCITCPDETE